MIGKYVFIFVLQLIFNILRVEEIKFSYENDTKKLIVNSILMNSLILASTYFSLTLLLQGNWFIIISHHVDSSPVHLFLPLQKP